MAILYTYDDTTRREDLLDLIVNLSPVDTPALSGFDTVEANGTYHEWMTDSLDARGDNAAVEGADPTYPTLTAPTRAGAITQIFSKPFQVSGTQRSVKHAGVSDAYLYQAEKALTALTNDIEHAIHRGSVASGTGSAARRLNGLLNAITTTSTTVASGTSLTETIYNDLLQAIYTLGGDPDETYVGARVKRQISGFTASNTRNIAADDRRLVRPIDVYESEFGMQKIFLARDQLQSAGNGNSLVALQRKMFRTAWLRRPFKQDLAKTGDADNAQYIAECTLEYGNEQSSGILLGIAG